MYNRSGDSAYYYTERAFRLSTLADEDENDDGGGVLMSSEIEQLTEAPVEHEESDDRPQMRADVAPQPRACAGLG